MNHEKRNQRPNKQQAQPQKPDNIQCVKTLPVVCGRPGCHTGKLTEYYTARGIIELIHYGYIETVRESGKWWEDFQIDESEQREGLVTEILEKEDLYKFKGGFDHPIEGSVSMSPEIGLSNDSTFLADKPEPKPGEWWTGVLDGDETVVLLGDNVFHDGFFQVKNGLSHTGIPISYKTVSLTCQDRPATEQEIEKTLLELAELKGFEGEGVYQEWVLPWSVGCKPTRYKYKGNGDLCITADVNQYGHVIYKGGRAIYSDKHGFAELKSTKKTPK